jgi:outer membrane protein insertion porin family
MGDGQRYLYDYKRVHFPDLQRFVFRTVVWTKKTGQFSSSISYSKQFLNDFRTQRVDKLKASIYLQFQSG